MTLTLPLLLSAFASPLLGAAPAAAFELTSPELAGGKVPDAHVFNGFGCAGGNQSPSLAWKDAPAGTQSFAVLVHDPDAPTGGAGWWHWVVYDIPATATGLPAGAGNPGGGLPAPAAQAPTDFGAPGWGGPCPPPGDKPHRYQFTVYALKVPALGAPAGATASLVGFLVNGQALGKATLTATYGR